MLVSGGWLKSCVSKFWVAQNCARKFRVTILLRDPLTIPGLLWLGKSAEFAASAFLPPHLQYVNTKQFQPNDVKYEAVFWILLHLTLSASHNKYPRHSFRSHVSLSSPASQSGWTTQLLLSGVQCNNVTICWQWQTGGGRWWMYVSMFNCILLLELKTKLCEVWSFTITEKAPTKTFSWFKALSN